MKKVIYFGKELIKLITTAGNGLIFTGVSTILAPGSTIIKIIAGVSGCVVAGMLSDKTDKYIDKKAIELESEIKDLASEM